ncbi:MAG: PAS domain S-box protein [Methanoregula sp.]|nr:MAG: PAS domain S-box protein [Methanoregula sp.]
MKKTVKESTGITAHEILLTERNLSLALAAAATLDEVLPQCLDAAIRLSGMDSGGIYLVNQKSGDLDLFCSSGLSDGFIRETTHIPTDSPSARLVLAKKNIYSTYPALKVPIRGERAKEGIHAIAILPILYKERVIACFNIASHVLDSIPEQSRSILESFTSLIGNSIARIQVEEALQQSENRYRNIIEDQTEFVCRFTPEGNLTFVNDAYCRYFGLNRNECIGNHHTVNIPPDDAGKMREHIKALTPENPVTELRHRIVMPDGQIRWQRWSDRAIFDKKGHVVEYQSVGRDITDVIATEDALRDSEEKYRTLIERANDGIVIIQDGIVRFANQRLGELWGGSIEEITGRPLTDFVHPDAMQEIIERYKQRMAGETPPPVYETILKHKDGSRFNAELNAGVILYKKKPADLVIIRDMTERKRAEEELREMSLFQESVISNANVWLMVLDEKGKILLWNNAAAEISGYPAHEVIGTNRIWRSLYPDRDYRKKITDTLTGIIKEKKYLQNFETTINCRSGGQKVILWNTRGLEGEKGQGARFVAIGVDITKSIRAEEALRESEERYRSVVEDQTEFICRFTSDGTLTFVNDAYCRYFGLKNDECIGKHHNVNIPPDDARRMKQHIKALTRKNPVALIDHRIIMPSGEIRWQRWSDRAIFDKDGRVVEYQTVGRDITEQKQAEKALQDSERRFSDIISFIPDATFAIDRQGKIIAWNRAIEKMTGVAAGDMIGKGDHEYGIPFYGERRPILIDLIFGDNEEITKKYPAIQKKGDKFISEIFIQRLYGGKGAHLWFIASPLYDTNGNVTGAIESIRDVSDRKRAEEALIKLNEELEQRVKERTEQINASLEEKVVLLREIHHRVKNNLQIIISLLKLQSRYMTDENTVAAFRECQNRVMAMSLVHEKLYQSEDISKIDLGNYVRFLGNSLFQFFGRSEKGVTFSTDIRNISLDINTAIPVGLMINELVSNSLKHAFPDGKIGEISIAIHQKERQLTIVYKDTGVGIPQEFDWRKAKSLGLRLVISLVEQLFGTIELDRTAGTVFTIVVNEK